MSSTNTTAAPSMTETYIRWDKLLATRDSLHHQTLRIEMLRASDTSSSGDVELWWRLAALTNAMFENINSRSRQDEIALFLINAKAKQYAQRALSLASGHFQANLTMAEALSNELVITSPFMDPDFEDICLLIKSMNDHLCVCSALQPNHYSVLLLEAKMHLMYNQVNLAQHPVVLRILPNLTPLDFPQIEVKLRHAITLKDDCFQLYYYLFETLITQDKLMDAFGLIRQALTIERKSQLENFMVEVFEAWTRAREREFRDDAGDHEVIAD